MKTWSIATLLAIVFLSATFLTLKDNHFLWDDVYKIDKGVKDWTTPAAILQPDYMGKNHFGTYLFLGFVQKIFGTRPFPFYFALLLFHSITFILMIRLSFKIGLDPLGAAAAALFFLVLGVHFQSIGWIASTPRVMMSVFLLSTLLLFDRYRKTNHIKFAVLCYVTWTMALISSEDAVIIPFLFLLYDLLILKTNLFSKANRRLIIFYIPVAIIFAGFLFIQFNFYGGGPSRYISSAGFEGTKKIAGVLWTVLNLFIPRREALPAFIPASYFVRLMVPIILFSPIFIIFRPKFSLSGMQFSAFCLLWFAATLSPFMLRVLKSSWMEFPPARYFYIPMIGLSLLGGKFLGDAAKKAQTFKSPALRKIGLAWLCLAFFYFYSLNAWTFCFMVDKLDRSWIDLSLGKNQIQNTEPVGPSSL